MRPDRYPTRAVAAPRFLERQEAVLHGDGQGPLVEEALSTYERRGFLKIPGFLTGRETAALRAALEGLAASPPGDETVVREPDGPAVRSVFAAERACPAVHSLVRSERLLAVVHQLLGGPVYVHQCRVNFKPGFDGQEFFWHSDFETWHAEDGMEAMKALSAVVHVTESRPENGPLLVVPGSHKHFVSTVGETPPDHHRTSLRRQEIGVPDRASLTRLVDDGGIEALDGPAGTLVVFDCNLMHGSSGNITPWPRTSLFVVFNRVDNALGEPFAAPAPRPEHIACRDPRPVEADRP